MNYREKIREQINKYPYGEYYGLKPNQPKDIIRLLNEMDRADEYIKTLYFKNENLQSKIDKAIEFIKESNTYYEITHYIPEDEKQFKINMETLTNHLLDILKEDK